MSFRSSVYPSRPASVERGKIQPPAVEKSAVAGPFTRAMEGDSFIERHPLPRPMQQSVWVMRAIKRIVDPIYAAPLEFKTVADDGTETPFKNPALKLYWEKPVRNMSFEEFVNAAGGWLKLRGEIFILLDDTWFNGSKKKNLPILARPASMREVICQRDMVGVNKGDLLGWIYTDLAGVQHTLIPDYVIHYKEWNPYHAFRGLSEMEAAMMAAEADYLQGRFANNLAKNNGDRGLIVVATGNPPNETQQRQIVEQLRMKRLSAMRGENRPIFLSSDIKIEDPSIEAPDADFISQRLENRHEVAIAFGVPPSQFDVVASYSVGSASDRYILIEDTCIPTSRKIATVITTLSRLLLGNPNMSLHAAFNFDSHSVMMQVRVERLAAADKLWAKGVPMEVCNDYLKLNLPEYDGWDKGYLPFNVIEVGTEVDPTKSADFAEKPPVVDPQTAPENDPAKTIAKLFSERANKTSPGSTLMTPELAKEIDDVLRAGNRRESLWKAHMAQRQASIKNYRTKFRKVLFGARSEVLAKLAAHYTSGKTIETKAGASTAFMFDLHSFAAEFKREMEIAGRDAFDEAGQQLYDELGKDDPWVSPPAKVKEFLKVRENRLKDVPQEVYDTINHQIQEGVDAGDSIKDLSSRVRSAFNEIDTGRSRTIAMTETGAAFGTARQEAMASAGIEYKEWLTSHNDNVRPAHAEAEGQVRAVDEPFDVDGEELDFPGDPDGSADNVINCHCVALPRMAPDEKSIRCEKEKRK